MPAATSARNNVSMVSTRAQTCPRDGGVREKTRHATECTREILKDVVDCWKEFGRAIGFEGLGRGTVIYKLSMYILRG